MASWHDLIETVKSLPAPVLDLISGAHEHQALHLFMFRQEQMR
jgi:hypothetical protein